MILEIKSWCEGIVVAVILCIIIEGLIPDGNNKKYIKVITGLYIMYVTFLPIFNLLNYEIDFKNVLDEFYVCEEVNSYLDNNIKDVYILSIEENIKKDIKELGYDIDEIKIFVDKDYENIEKIELKKINSLNNFNKEKDFENEDDKIKKNEIIKDYIVKNYNIEMEKIEIK